MRQHFSIVWVMEHWHSLSWEAIVSSLEIFISHLDVGLGILLWASCFRTDWTRWLPEVLSNLNHSVKSLLISFLKVLSLNTAPCCRNIPNHSLLLFIIILSSYVIKNSLISLQVARAHRILTSEQKDIRGLLSPDSGADGRCFATPHKLQTLWAGLPQVRSTGGTITLFQSTREEERAVGGRQLVLLALQQLKSPFLKENLLLIFPAYFLDLLCWSCKARRE